MYLLWFSTLLYFVAQVRGACESYGIDFVNGGSYFIDDTEPVDFTFLTQFEGCDGEDITPILVDPEENEYFCSDIATSPDDTSMLSTCPILQTAMFSGDWYIVIEGLTFAYVRTFEITAGAPTTITATPTVTAGVTIVPNATTTTSTSKDIESTTLLPSTITDACQTIYITKIVVPPLASTTVVKTQTITSTTKTTTKTTSSTFISTAICTPPSYPKGPDPALQKVLVLPHITISPPSSNVQASKRQISGGKDGKRNHARDMAFHKARGVIFNLASNAAVMKRGPDEPTVIVTETTYTSTTTTTSTLATPIVVQTAYTTSISTITPKAVTVCQGVTKVTTTTTLPTHTITLLSVMKTTVYVTKSVTLCHTIISTITPAPLSTSCVQGGGHI